MIPVYGLIQIHGGMAMVNDIVGTLQLMCDKNNPQDNKLLLLAELVETRCGVLGDNQAELKASLAKTNDKLDKITELLEKYETDKKGCPVYKNKTDFEKAAVLLRYPKITLLTILGIMALLGGFFSASIVDLLKFILGV